MTDAVKAIGWAPKLNRDGQATPRCWITDTGYTVAELNVAEQVTFSITPPHWSAPMAYRTKRSGVLAVIQAHMAGEPVSKFEGRQ
ncbi:hypothetical protein [Pseudomonas sp. B392_1p]|uniref:hypothetical protein n=1 Tax=Pseudomonas sp. B392_1p TaxID=3457507 RepID=UPI003FD591AC